ncbi:hypothetical protein RRG08_039194 [Elysia crispata]|uniref:LRAT domain-containing protein n=1 Tax=Elysia crispata TaxID=231223 RepID=A0AAE1ASX5_9GAST|nr:hypothetical protein RRG08_039194 [Elysia crispata]
MELLVYREDKYRNLHQPEWSSLEIAKFAVFCPLRSSDHYSQGASSSWTSKDLWTVEPGSRLEVEGGAFNHWAIYLGDQNVCYLTSLRNGESNKSPSSEGCVYVEPFTDMMAKYGDSEVYVDNCADRKWSALPQAEIVKRAISKKGLSDYHLINYNSESFVNWCRYNKTESDQIKILGDEAAKYVKRLNAAAALLVLIGR